MISLERHLENNRYVLI